MAKATKGISVVAPVVPAHQFRWGHGFELKDVISGYTGYVVYRVDNITGCDQYGIQAESIDNTKAEHHMFDATRLEFTGKIKLLPPPIPNVVDKPGGLSKPIIQHKIK